jgi:hypothetical protein
MFDWLPMVQLANSRQFVSAGADSLAGSALSRAKLGIALLALLLYFLFTSLSEQHSDN